MTDTTIIFETFLAPAQYKLYLYITEYIERSIHVPAFLLNGEALEDFEAGYADAGFIDTISFLRLQGQNPCSVELIAAPLLLHAAPPPAFFDIVVHNDSPYTELRDLHGCTWVSYMPKSHVENSMPDEPVRAAFDFTDTIEAASQAQLLRLLLNGKAHVAAVEARTMEIVQHNSPRLAAQLRIIGSYCLASGPLVVVASRIDATLKQRIREAFLTIHLHPFYAQRLQNEAIERFIPVVNPSYLSVYERNWQLQASLYPSEMRARASISESTL